MKKLFFILFLGAISSSCSSDSSSGPTLSNVPEAKAEFDNNNYGIYKGVFVGSSGTVYININNEGVVSATLTIDGSSSTYSTTETVTENSTTEGLTFTNGSNSFDFNVNADGTSPTISNVDIIAHANARMEIIKEQSDSLARCYIGSFSGDDNGTFNVVFDENGLVGLAKSDEDDNAFYLYGGAPGETTINGYFPGGNFGGIIEGNTIQGGWENDIPESGSWFGIRKL
ncbi:MAG: hypothetical protein V4648_09065 [Bacteroidota bacterium]